MQSSMMKSVMSFFGAGVGGLYDGAGGFPDSGELLVYGCLGEVSEY